ncbi:DUF368 domain-containing protein [Methanoculleus chikugoensis]|uniref:undecaprenyl phosphate translocase family protein n=1 Tax=Methanoculleus chikugoensis TaxID=118126 RepID=UPI000AEAD71B|nr:DUF368 domain-containing protein [Methanoculleus chikugoensis]
MIYGNTPGSISRPRDGGACDIIPRCLWGGTIALITGIYERLVGAIGSVDLPR